MPPTGVFFFFFFFSKRDLKVRGGGAGKGEGREEKGKKRLPGEPMKLKGSIKVTVIKEEDIGNSLLPLLAFQFGERLRFLKQNNVEVLRLK